MKIKIKIGNKFIDEKQPCFIIAEAGVNHNGKFDLAKKLVDSAKESGADAVKFQVFRAENLVTSGAERAKYQKKNIGGKESQYEMLKRLELSYFEFEELKKYCDEKGIIFLTTPHSCKEDVDLAARLCPVIKVGSGDLTNMPILEYIAKKNLSVILSTGMADLEEVRGAIKTIKKQKNNKIILLHCTTNYPTPLNEANLKAILTMKKEFKLPVGYSDHTEGIKVSLAAVTLGACVIEKHFTLDKKMPGPDHKASLETKELKKLINGIRKVEKRLKKGEKKNNILRELNISEALGNGIKKPKPGELETMKVARKSIIAVQDIKKGTKIKEDILVIKRPGNGIQSKYLNRVLGKTAKDDIKKDELITFEKLI